MTSPLPTPASDSPWHAAENLIFYGLQRSGNHAIINWAVSLFDDAHYVSGSDLDHGFFDPTSDDRKSARQREELRNIAPPVAVFAFEDNLKRCPPGVRFPDSVSKLVAEAEARMAGRMQHWLVLRDPYNTAASRIVALRKGYVTCDPSMEVFLSDWKALARRVVENGESAVLYNRWVESAEYRRSVAERMGGDIARENRDKVSYHGGGSSFEGAGAYTGREILDGLRSIRLNRAYLRLKFRQRHLILQRLFRPAPPGSRMKTAERWRALADDPEMTPVLADTELARLSDAIFGFHVGPSGRVDADG